MRQSRENMFCPDEKSRALKKAQHEEGLFFVIRNGHPAAKPDGSVIDVVEFAGVIFYVRIRGGQAFAQQINDILQDLNVQRLITPKHNLKGLPGDCKANGFLCRDDRCRSRLTCENPHFAPTGTGQDIAEGSARFSDNL
jgi:hypothetical protein